MTTRVKWIIERLVFSPSFSTHWFQILILKEAHAFLEQEFYQNSYNTHSVISNDRFHPFVSST